MGMRGDSEKVDQSCVGYISYSLLWGSIYFLFDAVNLISLCILLRPPPLDREDVVRAHSIEQMLVAVAPISFSSGRYMLLGCQE